MDEYALLVGSTVSFFRFQFFALANYVCVLVFSVPYPLTLCNVLFLNHLSYTDEHNERVFKATLAEIFLRENRLRYIIAIEMPKIETKGVTPSVDYSLLRKYSTVFYPRIFSTKCSNTQKIHVLHRDDYLKKMHYRKAV